VIPTRDEWYKAAYYDPQKGGPGSPGYWNYPMKSDSPTVPSNDLTVPPTSDPGNNANFRVGFDFSVGYPYFRSEFGAFANSESAYNTFDQGGNVREWTEDRGGTTWYRYTRGGDWDTDSSYLQSGTAWGYSPIQEYQMVGFRVALVPEPGSIVLLFGAAAAGCVAWRRRK
jgi:formylglycine-generating enzyme required for sulfatase activity